ncbi:MAG: DUF58 domain-containing protein [Microbacterium sp.]|nr:MAG: DUF58 domain-containing protein [Microbacterium sp.]
MRARWPLTVRGTGALALAVACFVAAQSFGIAELVYVGALLVVAVVASVAVLHLVHRGASVVRSFDPDIVGAGGTVDVRLRIELRSPLPSGPGRWSDALPDGIRGIPGAPGTSGALGTPGTPGAPGTPGVPRADDGTPGPAEGDFPETASGMRTGGTAVALRYTARALRRGIHQIGPLTLIATDPFGFARRRRTVGRPLALTVTPAIVELPPLSEQPGDAGGSMNSTTDQLGQGSDNLIPRHYVAGDSMRRIHWRASAHRDQLMVRQEEQETTPEAIVVLDRAGSRWDADAQRMPGLDPPFETAVSACVSAAARLVHEGYIVTVLDADGTPLADTIDGGDTAAVESLAVALATATAVRESPSEPLVALLASTMTGPLVYVTGTLTERDAAVLSPLVHHSILPVLLAVTPGASHRAGSAHADALGHAASAGWRVGGVAAGADLAEAWAGVVGRGARRVGV